MNYPKQPRVGSIVLFTPNPDDAIAKSNHNHDPIPAIITRIWGPVCVNLKIIPDCGAMQDRTSVVHISQNPAGYNWQYDDERDSINPDENINLMKQAAYQMVGKNGTDDDYKLIEGFFEGLRTKSKVLRGKWINVTEGMPHDGVKVYTKDSEGQIHQYTYFKKTKSWRSDGKEPGWDNNNAIVEWLEE